MSTGCSMPKWTRKCRNGACWNTTCVAPWPVVEAATRQVLARGGSDGTGTGHVFNLGHGVLPEADVGILAAVVDLVHAESTRG